MLVENSGPATSQGWTLIQALERTAEPKHWDSWLAAKVALDKATAKIPAGPDAFLHSSPQEISNRRRAATAAFDYLKAQLWEILTRGLLHATGSRDDRSVPPAPIYREGWQHLRTVSFEKSIVQERGDQKRKIYNVRIFPIIHADAACDALGGSSLSAAFKKCVLEDPEVVASSKRIRERSKYSSFFEQGQYPGLGIDYKWPLDLTAEDLTNALIRPSFYIDYEREFPKGSPETRHAAAVIVDRWRRLRQRLLEGEIGARATFVTTGVVREIDQFQWGRSGLSVDIQSGDLFEEEQNKLVLRWSGISLFHVKPLQPDALPPVTITPQKTPERERRPSPTPRQSSAQRAGIAEAIPSLWPEGIPATLLIKSRDQAIIEWLQKAGYPPCNPKTISRYVRDQQQR